MLAGNHDHGVAAGWIDARLQSEPSGFLGLEQRFAPEQAGPLAQRLAEAAAPRAPAARLSRASGCATTSTRSTATTPTCTRRCRPSSAWRRGRWRATSPGCPSTHATADDYEAVLSPLYAWLHALTQRSDHSVVSVGGSASAGTYASSPPRTGTSGRSTLALAAGYRAAVFALNRAGLGPLEASLSPSALRRGYLPGSAR